MKFSMLFTVHSFPTCRMNIPPDDVNDLNRGPAGGNPIINAVWDIGSAILNANREWTGAHDLAARIAVPIAVLAVTGKLIWIA